MVHGHIGLIGAVHAQHTDKLRIGGRIGPQPHQSVGDGIAQQPGQFHQLRGAIREDHPAAGVDHRPFGLENQFHRLTDLAGMALHRGVIGTQLDLLGIIKLKPGGGDILGQVHQNRTGSPGIGDIESLFKGLGQLTDILDQEVMFDTGAGDTHRVHLLKGIVADQFGGHLTGEDYHGCRVHIGGGDTGHRIGQTRPRGHQDHSRLARGPGVAIGGVGGSLLVAYQHMLDIVLLVEGIVNMQYSTARITEQVFDTLLLKATDDNLGAGQFHSGLLTSSIGSVPFPQRKGAKWFR